MNITRPNAASTVFPSASAASAASASTPEYQTELSNDPLGIVASYLAPDDQLIMRQASDTVRNVVDPNIHDLALTGEQAIDLLGQRNTFSNLHELRLADCTNADVVRIAELLTQSPSSRCGISLSRRYHYDIDNNNPRASDGDFLEINDESVCALARVGLSSLTLDGFDLSPALFAALSQRAYPISLDISNSNTPNVDLISQLPSLTSLNVGEHRLTATTVSALSAHPTLTTLKLSAVDANTLRDLLANPTLTSLSVRKILGNAADVYEAIANHPNLTTINLPAPDTTSVAAIARNVRLKTIELHSKDDATPALPLLAGLPQLESLRVVSYAPLEAEHLLAFNDKPLQSLDVSLMEMDHSACSALVALRTNKLSFSGDTASFGHEHVSLLSRNDSITSLDIQGGIDEATATQLLQNLPPNLIELSLTVSLKRPESWSMRMPAEAIVKNALSAQWVASGMSAQNLKLTAHTLD